MRPAAASSFAPVQPSLGRAGPFGLSYRELTPPPALAADVVCFWQIDAAHPVEQTFRYRIAPDACVDLVFDVAQGGAWIYGTQAASTAADLAGEIALFGIRIRPGRLARLLGHPAGSIAGGTFALEDVLGRAAIVWQQQLGERHSAAARAEFAAARLLAGRLPSAEDERGAAVIDAIVAGGGLRRIATVAAEHGITPRHLQRVCVAATGLSPKQLGRVIRFQRALSCLTQAPAQPLATVAVQLGYFDQAHLTNEIRVLLGATPGELRRARSRSDFSNPSHHGPR